MIPRVILKVNVMGLKMVVLSVFLKVILWDFLLGIELGILLENQ